MSKPSIPKGTRDFIPAVMARRNFIFNTIKSTYQKYGYLPIETPAMENLQTLTGKYGDEGDQLIFKLLNNGNFLSKADKEAIANEDYKKTAFSICKKALRYDLTVPFARFVVMNQNELSFPFKRYQIQPVWRGDRPGRGRYQEFFQCDADVVGSDSLLFEVELIQIFDEVLGNLGLKDFTIKLNNRKVLAGIAEVAGISDRLIDFTVAVDKLDKVGQEGVEKELTDRGFTKETIDKLSPIFSLSGDNDARINQIETMVSTSEVGCKGVEELRYVVDYISDLGLNTGNLLVDVTLARGLNYYTGAIFEVVSNEVSIGSICGGGRYDDLCSIFGLKNVSGVGISFGADRIYDVMNELNLFEDLRLEGTELMFVNFGEKEERFVMKLLAEVRSMGISSEVYPTSAKLKKQMKYANDKSIPFVALIGDQEMASGQVMVKNMESGEQKSVDISELASHLRS